MTGGMIPINVLLVDDLEENLLSLEALLHREDLTLLKARSGNEALELLLIHDMALALVDIQMPGMDGFELAEFMRGNERTRHVPIIFLTAGHTDRQRRFRGYEAGAVDFIEKPIEADILRSKVNVFFELHQQRQLLAIQRDELAKADRQKDHFLAELGHELRNPITALLAGLHLMKKRTLVSEIAPVREQMERQLHHMSRLVDDLLDISRISEGKISLRPEKVDVADVIQSAVEATRSKLDAKQHKFEVRMPPGPIWLVADHTRLSQVVANLLNNAAKYTPTSGTILLETRMFGSTLEISVTDNGVGIPLDMQARVFDIFTQVDAHRSHAQDGLGIGLSLVRKLVQLHGGEVSVFSEGVNRGSVFTVSLPLDGKLGLSGEGGETQ